MSLPENEVNGPGEVRAQYLLPHQLTEKMSDLPLIYIPVGVVEWHSVHMALGTDAINAENVTVALARKTGGVVFPTIYMGTERERPPEVLDSLGLEKDAYVVGMDFPEAKGLVRSFYFPEEVFAIVVRSHIELCIANGYKYIYIVNGHGAVNHNEVLRRLCTEFTGKAEGVKVACEICFPKAQKDAGSIAHAGYLETSLMLYYGENLVDLEQLPPAETGLKYCDYSIVDGGGFDGHPGEDHCVPDAFDPRLHSSAEEGKRVFELVVEELAQDVKQRFELD